MKRPSAKLFMEFAQTETGICVGRGFSHCARCGRVLWRSSETLSYDPRTGKPYLRYSYACPNVLEEGKRWKRLPWYRRLFHKPHHEIGCHDYGY